MNKSTTTYSITALVLALALAVTSGYFFTQGKSSTVSNNTTSSVVNSIQNDQTNSTTSVGSEPVNTKAVIQNAK
jgi:hypothetical protein